MFWWLLDYSLSSQTSCVHSLDDMTDPSPRGVMLSGRSLGDVTGPSPSELMLSGKSLDDVIGSSPSELMLLWKQFR